MTQPRSILIVEGAPANLAIADLLERQNYRVRLAGSGEEGLRRAGLDKPDLILLDLRMPGTSGIEVCRRLKAQPETRDIPVLFMIEPVTDADRSAAFAAGGADYIAKPFQADEALARIASHLELGAMRRRLETQDREMRLCRERIERLEAERRQLHASEQAFRALVENAPDNIARYDRQGRMLYVNPRLEATLGMASRDLLGKTPRELFPDADLDSIIKVAETGQPIEIEIPWPDPDGGAEVLYHCLRLVAERGVGGEIVGVMAIGRDVTATKRAERELLLLHHALNHSHDATYLVDERMRLRYVNEAACRALGYSREELLSLDLLAIDPNVSREAVQAMMRRTRASGIFPGTFETWHRRKDGQLFPVETGGSAFEYDGETLFLTVARDITEQKKAEHELRANERKFRTLTEHLPDNIVRYDRTGRTVYVNPTLERTLGDDAAALIGTTVREYHPDGGFEDYAVLLEAVLATGTAGELEKALPAPPGQSSRIHHIRMVPERDENGAVVGVLVIGSDITERKQAEQERLAHLRFLESMDRINRAIRATDDIEKMMNAVLDSVLSIFGCDRAFLLYPCDPEAAAWSVPFERTRPAYPGARENGATVPMDADTAGKLRLLLAADGPVKFGPGAGHALPAATVKRFGIRCMMTMALHPKVGMPWEFGIQQCAHPRVWNADEERLLQEIGHRVADALTGLLAFRDLRDSEWKFRSLVENIPDLIVRYNLDLCRSYVNPAWEALSGLSAKEVVDVPVAAIPNVPQPAVASYLAKIHAALATGTRQEAEFIWINAHGIPLNLSYVVVPEFDRAGKIAGALAVGRDITQLRETERRLHESYDLLHELASRRETSREEERKHIAREIHDELGQYLTALRMGISALGLQFRDANPALAEQVKDLTTLASQTIQVVRHLATSLRPAVLDAGIEPALEWLVAEYRRHAGIPIQIEVIGKDHRDLDEKRATTLFRIVQESLTNITRHAHANWASVYLARQGDGYIVEIRDDGRGFDLEAMRGKSLGLIGMRERALTLGGELRVDSGPGQGTKVMAHIPIHDKRDTP